MKLSTSSRILFLIYHGTGHFNICFPLARHLQKNNTILFAGHEYFKKYVALQEFDFHPLTSVPFGMNFEDWVNQQKKKNFTWWHSLRARWSHTLYQHRKAELQALIVSFKPDYIFFDAVQSTDFIVLYPFIKGSGIRVGMLHIMIPTALFPGQAPINSLSQPHDHIAVKKDSKKFYRSKYNKQLMQKVKYLFHHDTYLIRTWIKRNRIPSTFFSPYKPLFGIDLQYIPSFVLVPSSFNFPDYPLPDDQHYLGLHIDHERQEVSDPEFLSVRKIIYQHRAEKQTKIIYCAFGTLPPRDKKNIIQLLQRIVQGLNTGYTILISFACTSEERALIVQEQAHVLIFDTLPQLDILKHTDVFVTHGGLNSVLESIEAEVPMLACPLDDRTDHFGNTARMVFHSLGLYANARDETTESLVAKVEDLLSNPVYKQRLQQIKNKDTGISLQSILQLAKPID